MTEFDDLDRRSREVFQKIVESYLDSGDPVGSSFLVQSLSEKISSATVRNVMAKLEQQGLLGSPHTSAGRLPTERGLRFFVDGILEMKDLNAVDQSQIRNALTRIGNRDDQSADLVARTGTMLSQLSHTASLVFSKKQDRPLKHVDFVWISPEQALVILVDEGDHVDNRLFTPPIGMTPSDLQRAANFINAQLEGHTLSELQSILEAAIVSQQRQIDEKMAHLISIGQAAILEGEGRSQLVVRGRSNLINDDQNEDEIETLRLLMDDLESKNDLVELLELSDNAEAVRVFIGSENKLFSLKSSSLVVSPYMNGEGKIIGAVGVIGPTRINYARIVPIVSYTANLFGKLLDKEDENERG